MSKQRLGESRISYREATHLTLADKFVPSALRVHRAENSVCCRPKRGGVSPLAQSLLNKSMLSGPFGTGHFLGVSL